MRRLVTAIVALALATGLMLALWPSAIAARAYRPPPGPPLDGPLEPNRELAAIELLGGGRLAGPEDVGSIEGRAIGRYRLPVDE